LPEKFRVFGLGETWSVWKIMNKIEQRKAMEETAKTRTIWSERNRNIKSGNMDEGVP